MITQLQRQVSPLDEDGLFTDIAFNWMLGMTNTQILIGSGSPEGVYEAQQGRQYMDQAGSTGSILYIKQLTDISGDRSMGWTLV